jgi:hypothetical protein
LFDVAPACRFTTTLVDKCCCSVHVAVTNMLLHVCLLLY